MFRRGAVAAVLLLGLALARAQDSVVVGGNGTTAGQWDTYTQAELDQYWNETGLGDDFARFTNTFLVGDVVLVKNATETDNICASSCDDSEDCTTWAWCASPSGCKVDNAGCSTTADVAFRTCILSSYDTIVTPNEDDPFNTGSAQVGVSGPTVPFISGIYRPTPESPIKWKAPTGKGWWDRFSVEEATFYGMASNDVPSAAADFKECAQRCDETDNCDIWNYCPEDATDGCFVPGYITCNTLFTVNAGFCLLGTGEGADTVSFWKFASDDIAFISGKRLPLNVTA
ncbi:hypothetical protein C2E21_7046 [Chlorella sorokiniana]|uniref:Apple domain-containing protein n=1 Tax=Chlorella sorokiniana TaxID=3076 RepID=A0A2P6TIT2_CHLSO|nr:hypothetical protein C2E21_7046 [Chlorella sorokiniana]|eukprot:PRW39157.1 hypothetical protein C2E21_7046 [Chlorella sorokiniana]